MYIFSFETKSHKRMHSHDKACSFDEAGALLAMARPCADLASTRAVELLGTKRTLAHGHGWALVAGLDMILACSCALGGGPNSACWQWAWIRRRTLCAAGGTVGDRLVGMSVERMWRGHHSGGDLVLRWRPCSRKVAKSSSNGGGGGRNID